MHSATPPLPTRPLGQTGIEVTILGVGCAWLGRRPDNSVDEESGLEAIVAALDSGVRLIDTAAALQYVVRNPVVTTTIPGARRPDQAWANANAMREVIPDAFWSELEPLVQNYAVAVAPPS
jgi:aryl-alcohol dehydrogenase-like predicted oxidoreductase